MRRSVFVLVAVLLSSGRSWGSVYIVTDLGFYDEPRINNAGQVAGQRAVGGLPHAETLAWESGTLTALGVWGGVRGINDAGQIVGVIGATSQSFIWNGGLLLELDPYPDRTSSNAVAINNQGQVLGMTGPSANNEVMSWKDGVWTGTGVTNVGNVGAINDDGTWVGYFDGGGARGFMVKNGVVLDLPGIGPLDVNNLDQVVGQASHDGRAYGYLWENSVLQELPFQNVADTNSAPKAINNFGQIVGDCARPGSQRAVLWQNGEVFDLNTLVTASGWQLQSASDINDQGWIVGRGYNPDGELTSFLLTPSGTSGVVPAPSSLVCLIGVGVMVGGMEWWKRRRTT